MENSTSLSRASFSCSARNAVQGPLRHERAVDDLGLQHGNRRLEHGHGAVVADVLDAQVIGGVHRHRLLVGAEVVLAHRGDVGLRVWRPRTHRLRVLAGVLLDRLRGAAVGVALAKHRVDGRALDLVVAGPDVALGVRDRSVGIVGERVALRLQLGDGGVELRIRRRDVGELDDVRFWEHRQVAELGEVVGHALLWRQEVGEQGQDAARQRDVAGGHLDAGGTGERLDDREERVRRQRRSFVGVGVDDRRRRGGLGTRHTSSVPAAPEAPGNASS